MAARTLYDKIWDDHVVQPQDDGTALLYIDRHLVHEVTSPQAYEGLELAGRKPWRVELHRGDGRPQHADHGLGRQASPTRSRACRSRRSTTTSANTARTPISRSSTERQGIVHVIGPEQGATLPGMTVVCGDSHTRTHGAFGALAHRHRHVARSSTCSRRRCCWRRKPRHAGAGRGQARPRRAPRRTSCWPSSARSARPAAPATRSSSPASAIRALSMEGAHDGVQHGHRSRRARRHGGGRRHHDRLRARAARSRRPARCGSGRSRYWRTLHSRRGREVRHGGRARCGRDQAAGHLGHVARDGGRRSTAACPIPTGKTIRSSASDRARADATWASKPNTPIDRHPASTRCSSARAPTRASRTCARPPRSCARPQGRGQREAGDGRAGLGPGEGRRPSAKGWTRCSAPPASNGASRAARCAWR